MKPSPKTTSILPRGTMVKDKFSALVGQIASAPFELNRNDNFCYAVALNKGFYSEDKKAFVSTLIVHESCLEVVAE